MLLNHILFAGTNGLLLVAEIPVLFTPERFFELNGFGHAELFDDLPFVWGVLSKIRNYLESIELSRIEASIQAGAFLIYPELISIGKGSVIEPGAYIQGPCVIGKNCVIRHAAYIRGDVIIGDECVVGHATELKNAVLLNGVHAAHFAYVGDSVLGNKVNLGAGVKCANLRLDRKEVYVHGAGKRQSTGLRKFGAIVGDGCQIGCNAVTNPGTIFEKGAVGLPCEVLSGVVTFRS